MKKLFLIGQRVIRTRTNKKDICYPQKKGDVAVVYDIKEYKDGEGLKLLPNLTYYFDAKNYKPYSDR